MFVIIAIIALLTLAGIILVYFLCDTAYERSVGGSVSYLTMFLFAVVSASLFSLAEYIARVGF